ncbi:MAG: hypothetical protein M3Q80_00330 [bacterium]|nr:hypothetical protein [bacterium]
MKKQIVLSVLMAALLCAGNAFGAQATNVTFHHLNASVANPPLGAQTIIRDKMMVGMYQGGNLDTKSRHFDPNGVEISHVMDANDMMVTTNGVRFYRGVWNPGAVFGTNCTGLEWHYMVEVHGHGGKVTLERVGYIITSQLGLLGKNATLAGNPYSQSRVGWNLGADGLPYTADDTFTTSGSGTNEFDRIIYFGARLGVIVNNQQDIDTFNQAIPTTGASVTCEYTYNNGTQVFKSKTSVILYRSYMIPQSQLGMKMFNRPNGSIHSLVLRAGSGPYTISSTVTSVTGPYTVKTTAGTEGSSVFLPYSTVGFVKTSPEDWKTAPPAARTADNSSSTSLATEEKARLAAAEKLVVVSSDEQDQDR